MTATSSTLVLADLALTWSVTRSNADLSLIDSDIASDRAMETAIMLSLFTDRRAFPDDVPPSGDPDDRRGWWADEVGETEGDLIGSRLWLLDRSVLNDEVLRQAQEFDREALQWMIDDRVASAITIKMTRSRDRMFHEITIDRPGRKTVSFRFDHVWDHQ